MDATTIDPADTILSLMNGIVPPGFDVHDARDLYREVESTVTRAKRDLIGARRRARAVRYYPEDSSPRERFAARHEEAQLRTVLAQSESVLLFLMDVLLAGDAS